MSYEGVCIANLANLAQIAGDRSQLRQPDPLVHPKHLTITMGDFSKISGSYYRFDHAWKTCSDTVVRTAELLTTKAALLLPMRADALTDFAAVAGRPRT